MNEKDPLATLSEIRALMERSSRFLSLSGKTGVIIGCYALAGAWLARIFIFSSGCEISDYGTLITDPRTDETAPIVDFLATLLLVILGLSALTALLLTRRRARQQGIKTWDASSKRLLVNLLIPLVTGGLFCLALLEQHALGLISPAMLIFYGLALVHASKYTYNNIRYLGFAEILLGLGATLKPEYGLLAWALGFGVLHILYGILMYIQNER